MNLLPRKLKMGRTWYKIHDFLPVPDLSIHVEVLQDEWESGQLHLRPHSYETDGPIFEEPTTLLVGVAYGKVDERAIIIKFVRFLATPALRSGGAQTSIVNLVFRLQGFWGGLRYRRTAKQMLPINYTPKQQECGNRLGWNCRSINRVRWGPVRAPVTTLDFRHPHPTRSYQESVTKTRMHEWRTSKEQE